MAAYPEHRVLRLVESEPEVLVHTGAERRLAAEHWLLSTLDEPGRARARDEWTHQGVALLPLGTLFSVVRIPGRLLTGLTAGAEGPEVDSFLAQALDGGPVVCDVYGPRYYALVPASMPATWHMAAEEWRALLDVDCLGRGTLFGIPKVDAVAADPATRASYWSVPMESAGVLCRPLAVARLVAAARHALIEESEA